MYDTIATVSPPLNKKHGMSMFSFHLSHALPPTCNRLRSSWFAATPPTTARARTPFAFSLPCPALVASCSCCPGTPLPPPPLFRPPGTTNSASPKYSPRPALPRRNSFSPKLVLGRWNSASPNPPPLGLWKSVSPKLLGNCGFVL